MSTKPDYYSHTKLFEILAAQGRSQRWLAAQTGWHESLISKYRRGIRPIPASFAASAAAALQLPVDALFFDLVRANDDATRAKEKEVAR